MSKNMEGFEAAIMMLLMFALVGVISLFFGGLWLVVWLAHHVSISK